MKAASSRGNRAPRLARTHTGELDLLALVVIWGVNFSVVKLVLQEVEPLAFNALRFPFAALTVWILLRAQGRRVMPRRRDWARVGWLSLFGHMAYQVFFIFGLSLTMAGNASLMLATVPMWIAILSPALGHERFSWMVLGGVAVTMTGLVLVILGGSAGFALGGETLRGDLFMLAAAVVWALYTVLGRRAVRRNGALEMTAWTLWLGTPVLVLMGLPGLLRTDFGSLSGGAWAGIAYAGVLAIGIAYFIWYRGVQRLGSSRTAVYSNLVPVAAILTAWLWIGETPRALQVLGAGVILAGIGVVRLAPPTRAGDRARRRALRERRRARKAQSRRTSS